MIRFAFLLLLFALFATPAYCVEVYSISGIEIRLYETRQELFQDLPLHIQATQQAIEKAVPGAVIRGWGDSVNRRIYAIKDWCVVFHELKHVLEPEWHHEIDRTDACLEVRIK